MRLKLNIKGKEYDIEISEEEGGVKIIANEKEFFFRERLDGREEIPVTKVTLPKRDFSKKEIKAPITGIISEILVKEGEFVQRAQKVSVLSSMKMENEIISDFEGRVKEILVKKNQKVKKDDTLITLQ